MAVSSILCKSVLKRSSMIGASGARLVWCFTRFSGASLFSLPVLVKPPAESILPLQTSSPLDSAAFLSCEK